MADNPIPKAPDLTALTSAFTSFAAKLAEATSAITKFVSSLKAPAPPTPSAAPGGGAGGGAAAALGPAAAGASAALGVMSGMAGAASSAVSAMASTLSTAGGGFQALGGAISGVSSMLSGVLGPAGAAVGQALGQVVSAIGEFLNVAQKWVELLAPGTIQLFNQALENLQATVGVAFEPIFRVMTDVAQKWAAALLPVMEQLRPIVEEVAKAIGGAFLQVVKYSAQMMQNWMPIIKALADLFVICMAALQPFMSLMQLIAVALQPLAMALEFLLRPLTQLAEMMTYASETFSMEVDAITNVMKAWQETLKALLPASDTTLKDSFKSLQDSIRDVVKQFYILVGTLAKFFGADAFLANLIKQLEPKTGQLAAPKNASIGSVESVAKDMATAAATASGSAETDPERTLADVVQELKSIQAGGDSRFTQLLSKLDRVISLLGGAGQDIAGNLGYDSRTEALADVYGSATGNPFAMAGLFKHVRDRKR